MGLHNKIGIQGEKIATRFLLEKNYVILERNWKFSHAEIDIIAQAGDIIVFVEVKTRSYDFYGKPEEFVDSKKERLLIDAAYAYLEQIDHQWELRFDIIGILLAKDGTFELKHFEDAFF